MKQLVGMLAVAAMLCVSSGVVQAGSKPSPTLGSSETVVNAAWTRDNRTHGCKRENLAQTCRYLYRGVSVAVSFDQTRRAVQFQTDGRHHKSFDMWQFLNTLVPRGAHLRGCRFVPHSVGGGTAHACVYYLKQSMIVAYFPHPADTDYGGLVTYDYEEYKDIQAGR